MVERSVFSWSIADLSEAATSAPSRSVVADGIRNTRGFGGLVGAGTPKPLVFLILSVSVSDAERCIWAPK